LDPNVHYDIVTLRKIKDAIEQILKV